MHTDEETGQVIIGGMGELHLDILVDRMKKEFNVECNVGAPMVSYRETFKQSAQVQGKFSSIWFVVNTVMFTLNSHQTKLAQVSNSKTLSLVV